MAHRRHPPWLALLIGAGAGGLCGLFTLIEQSKSHARLPLAPPTAILGGVALGVVAVQLLWIKDLLGRQEVEPGSMVLKTAIPREPDVPTGKSAGESASPSRGSPAALLALGLVSLGLNHAMAILLQRVHVALVVGGSFFAVVGLGGLISPRLLADPKRVSNDKSGAGAATWPVGLAVAQSALAAAALGTGLFLWAFVY